MSYVVSLLEPSILLLLHEQPTHGYDLIGRLRQLGLELSEDPGAVYRCLRSMERRGLVSFECESSTAGPKRKIYRATAAGEREMERWAHKMCEAQEILTSCIKRHSRLAGKRRPHLPHLTVLLG